ncbi:ABC transporter substrate-binding protein [Amycolatopsis nigrescens]|uniref:ABC transporter substrate-binding protein n=1 Tax=Amycolatopsis nigrescens TaxID=381445 RepID=UPI00058D4015|nr:ABC transporter substrate-binding protein [Amycolatopsis nigrescens]
MGATAVLAGAVMLAGCATGTAPQEQPGAATAGGRVTILTDTATQPFDPAKSQSHGVAVFSLVHRRLTSWDVRQGQPTKAVPDLATDTGRPTENGRTWTYTLKDGLKFADGTPITAADLKYGIERSFAPAFAGGLNYHKTLLAGADGYQGPFEGKGLDSVQTPDEKTIVFRLNRPYNDWPWVVSTPAFSPVPKGKGTEPAYSERPIASGPYQVSAYQKGVGITLSRNPFWDKKTDSVRAALPDEIVFQLGQDTGTVAQRLVADAGEDQRAVGFSLVSPAQLAQLQGNPAAQQRLVTSPSGALAYLALNTRRGPLADPKVRKAFQYAVDKSAFQVASAGNARLAGDPASTLIVPGLPGREAFDLYPAPPSGDPELAKRLLAEAGYPNGLTGLDFVVGTSGNFPEKAQAVQAGLARAGIQSTVRTLDSAALKADTTGAEAKFDLTLDLWQADFPSANTSIQPLFGSSEVGGGRHNLSRYADPETDRLIEEAQSVADPAEAGRKWAALDQRIMAESPVVPLVYARNSFLRGSKVAGFFVGEFPAYPSYFQVGIAP